MKAQFDDFSGTLPFLLSEDNPADASRIAGELVDVTLTRMLEILTRFAISLSGETPTPVVLDRVSRSVLSALGDHSTRYLSGLRLAVAQEESLGHVDTQVARLVTEIDGASESLRPVLEQELDSLRARRLRLSECVRRSTAFQARRSIEVLGGVSSVD